MLLMKLLDKYICDQVHALSPAMHDLTTNALERCKMAFPALGTTKIYLCSFHRAPPRSVQVNLFGRSSTQSRQVRRSSHTKNATAPNRRWLAYPSVIMARPQQVPKIWVSGKAPMMALTWFVKPMAWRIFLGVAGSLRCVEVVEVRLAGLTNSRYINVDFQWN